MAKDFIFEKKAGSRKPTNEPRCLSEILAEYFAGNSPLGLAYRNRLFEDVFPSTELSIDLKLFTLKPGRICENEFLPGMLTRDGENHYSFVQNATKKKRKVNRRNPQVFKGLCVNVIQHSDGTLYPTLNRPDYTKDFTFKDFCLRAAEELLTVASLGEK